MKKTIVIVKEIDEYGNETVKSYDKGSVKIKESRPMTGEEADCITLFICIILIMLIGALNIFNIL